MSLPERRLNKNKLKNDDYSSFIETGKTEKNSKIVMIQMQGVIVKQK